MGKEPESGSESASKQPLWKRLLPLIITVGFAAFLFGWVLPQFIDYEAVFRAIGEISASQWLVLLVVALVRLVPEGWVYRAALPGVSLARGISQSLVANAAVNIPPGGVDLVARYQMSRSWGMSPAVSTASTIGSWSFVTFAKLLLPLIAVLLLEIEKIRDDDLDALALLGLVILVLGSALIYMVLRSPNSAARIGRLLGRVVNWVVGWFRKEVSLDFEAAALQFRESTAGLFRSQWKQGLAAGLTAQLGMFVVLLLAVRFVGMGADQASFVVVFAAFAIVAALTVIPIFNGPGLAEATYIAILGNAVGSASADAVAAAVFVFRILTWLLPIPLGGIAFVRWRSWVHAQGRDEVLAEFTGTAS